MTLYNAIINEDENLKHGIKSDIFKRIMILIEKGEYIVPGGDTNDPTKYTISFDINGLKAVVEYKKVSNEPRLNNYIKVLISVFMAYASISCTQKDRFVKKLTNNKTEFWDEYNSKTGYILGSFSFDNKGKCFYYTNKNGKKAKIYEGDLLYTHTWVHRGDSILSINDFDNKILRFTADTLILLNTRINDTMILIKAK
jgi:hypothetical protein